MAKLYFYYGPVGSSKSTMLLTKAHSFEERGIPFICIKSSIDDRDGNDIIKSRIGISRECLTVEPGDNLFDFVVEYIDTVGLTKPLWILVDESQFLDSKQIDELSEVVDSLNINVLCYGLRTDFTGKMFEGSKRLMEIADNIEEMRVSCSCGKKAIINARIDEEGNVVTDGKQILIGGDDKYISLCRKCYREKSRKSC